MAFIDIQLSIVQNNDVLENKTSYPIMDGIFD